MSEQFPGSNHELAPSSVDTPHEQPKSQPELENNIQSDQLEAIRDSVEAASKHTRIEVGMLKETPQKPTATYASKELKAQALKRSLRHIQHDLPPAERMLSKTIHQPTIRRVSAVAEQTLARPSGLLGGGFCAFIGTLIYAYLSRHLGFSYNYFLFAVFFLGGFAIGIIGEFLLNLAAKLRHHTPASKD